MRKSYGGKKTQDQAIVLKSSAADAIMAVVRTKLSYFYSYIGLAAAR